MVSKLSFQAFPTAVNIYAAYEHHNKHGRSRSVLLQVNIQYSQMQKQLPEQGNSPSPAAVFIPVSGKTETLNNHAARCIIN